MAARLTGIGPCHQPEPGQPRPHPGDQRDRQKPIEPVPAGPSTKDPGQGVPGGVDDWPVAVIGEGAEAAGPREAGTGLSAAGSVIVKGQAP